MGTLCVYSVRSSSHKVFKLRLSGFFGIFLFALLLSLSLYLNISHSMSFNSFVPPPPCVFSASFTGVTLSGPMQYINSFYHRMGIAFWANLNAEQFHSIKHFVRNALSCRNGWQHNCCVKLYLCAHTHRMRYFISILDLSVFERAYTILSFNSWICVRSGYYIRISCSKMCCWCFCCHCCCGFLSALQRIERSILTLHNKIVQRGIDSIWIFEYELNSYILYSICYVRSMKS